MNRDSFASDSSISNYMKRINSFFSLVAIAGVLFLSACQQPLPDDALANVPEGVSFVTAINIPRLMEKAEFEKVRQMGFYQKITEQAAEKNPAFAEVLKDPASAGVDLQKNAYVAMILSADTVNEGKTVAFLFSIADKAKFEQAVNDIRIKALQTGNEPETALVWNEKTGIFVNGDHAQATADAWLNSPPNQTVARNKSLRKTLAREYDIANWVTSDALASIYPNLAEGLKKYTPKDFEGNHIGSYLYFEDDRVRGEVYVDLKKNLANDLNTFFRDRVKTDFTQLMPAEDQSFLLTAALDLHGIHQVLLERYIQGAAQQSLKEFGLSTEDIAYAFGGDVALSLYPGRDTLFNVPTPLLAGNIKDQARLNKLIDKAVEKGVLEKKSDNRYLWVRPEKKNREDSVIVTREDRGEILIKDNIVYLAPNGELLDRIAAGGFATQGAVADRIKGLQAENILSAYFQPPLFMNQNRESIPFEGFQVTARRNYLEGFAELPKAPGNSLFQLFQELEKKYQQDKMNEEAETAPEM